MALVATTYSASIRTPISDSIKSDSELIDEVSGNPKNDAVPEKLEGVSNENTNCQLSSSTESNSEIPVESKTELPLNESSNDNTKSEDNLNDHDDGGTLDEDIGLLANSKQEQTKPEVSDLQKANFDKPSPEENTEEPERILDVNILIPATDFEESHEPELAEVNLFVDLLLTITDEPTESTDASSTSMILVDEPQTMEALKEEPAQSPIEIKSEAPVVSERIIQARNRSLRKSSFCRSEYSRQI